ncbi:Cys-tRNA(Pro) deacylase [Aeromicrobium sp. CF4.19]|uniref:Cys-tRNA(Pro) deacylase n=1 Tax=Aeromicrobium sp. CF4.19 TaxID=3373082 RepID=UPI003EE4C43C
MARTNDRDATPALAALTRAGVAFTRHAYDHDPRAESYGQEAAERLGVDAARVLKTLVVDVAGELCVAVLPVSRQLDLKAAAVALGAKKAVLAEPGRAQRSTGYVLGAISPVGQRTPLRTTIDASATAHETVLVSAGRRGLEAELTPADLVRVTGAVVAALTR